MTTIQTLLTFLVPMTLLTLTPGVDTLLVVRNTSRGGWHDGAASSLGICCGLFVHALVSAVGISVILVKSALLFSVLKFAGAGYLIWLGGSSLRRLAQQKTSDDFSVQRPAGTAFRFRRSLLEGFWSNVLNPKTVVFYMAFLPQFIDPGRPAVPQILLLTGLHFIIAMLYQCLLASVVDRATGWLQNIWVRRTMDGVTGSVLLLFGVKLALDQ